MVKVLSTYLPFLKFFESQQNKKLVLRKCSCYFVIVSIIFPDPKHAMSKTRIIWLKNKLYDRKMNAFITPIGILNLKIDPLGNLNYDHPWREIPYKYYRNTSSITLSTLNITSLKCHTIYYIIDILSAI